MPYNPALPADHSPLVSAEMRGQLNGLNDRINAIPAGPQGPQGATGPPFANAVVDGVSTLNPGDPATVGTSFDGADVHFDFGIPRGATGADGPPGPQGPQGNDGPQGPTGEVSNAALAAAIAGTSNNTNAVALLGLVVSDPPTQAEVQAVASKLDEMISAMRR